LLPDRERTGFSEEGWCVTGPFDGDAMRDFVQPGLLRPIILVISRNGLLVRLVRRASKGRLEVVVRDGNAPDRELLSRTKPKLVVFDDDATGKSERIWMLKQIKRFAPEAGVLYVTAAHTPKLERLARAAGILYYGSFDPTRLAEVVHACTEMLLPRPSTPPETDAAEEPAHSSRTHNAD
jgi:hypothetical protein